MKEEQKRHYEAPRLTVVEFRTEQGFAGSGVSGGLLDYNNTSDNWFDNPSGGLSDYNSTSESWL